MTEITREHIDQNWETYLETLKTYLRFPTISALDAHEPDCIACAEFLVACFKKIGFQDTRAIPTPGKPIVWAHYEKDTSLPTVMIYGHYDVQPVDPLEEWTTDPFTPTIKEGYIYGRGTSDNKGQFWAYLTALTVLYELNGTLPVNIKCIIEGEEEIGSPHLFEFIQEDKDMLKADHMWLSDNPMLARDTPSICTSLRGIACSEITVQVAHNDLHSGLHGGAAPNALDVLTRLLVRLKDEQGGIRIPDFYEGVSGTPGPIHISTEENETYRKTAGAYYLTGEYGKTVNEQRWKRPTLDIHGIIGGYQESGIKTVIPCKATAKISMRLVEKQHPKAIQARLTKYLEAIKPEGVTLTVTHFHGALPIEVDPESKSVAILRDALSAVTGKKTCLHGEGGSIPILSCFQDTLGLDPIMLGLGFADDAIHAPNERFWLANGRMGVEAVISALLAVERS